MFICALVLNEQKDIIKHEKKLALNIIDLMLGVVREEKYSVIQNKY